MPVNPHFSFYTNRQEQSLMESLVNEALAMFGFESYYIPKNETINPDLLYGEDPLKAFIDAYPIHVYMSNPTDPGTNQDFFSKFGLEIKNNTRVLLSKRVFDRMVENNSFGRPIEGDLIYIPWLSGTGELYEIKYVNDSSDFFILGRKHPYYWELELELFKYSHEPFETGVPEINTISEDHSYSIIYEMHDPFVSSAPDYYPGELVQQEHFPFYYNIDGKLTPVEVEVLSNKILIIDKNNIVQSIPLNQSEKLPVYTANGKQATLEIIRVAQATVVDWDRSTQNLRLKLIQGVFLPNSYINGTESGAMFKIAKYNPIDLPMEKDSHDNYNLQVMSDKLIDTTETNPFLL